MEDLYFAGGLAAVMQELKQKDLLHLDYITVTGKTLGENIQGHRVLNPEVVHPVTAPYSIDGGLAILFGNLAPEGAVVKKGAVAPEMMKHQGPARVFNSENDAVKAILNDQIHTGDVVVIRYEGPQGGPGMQEKIGRAHV